MNIDILILIALWCGSPQNEPVVAGSSRFIQTVPPVAVQECRQKLMTCVQKALDKSKAPIIIVDCFM